MSEARASTDQESAPLLDEGPDDQQTRRERDGQWLEDLLHQPPSAGVKILLAIILALLLLCSVFVGLFAGLRHRIGEDSTHRTTETVTYTVTSTETVGPTSTATTVDSPKPTESAQPGVCISQNCVLLAASLLSSLDTSHDPCENFYDFATGGWRQSHPIPPNRGIFDRTIELASNNKHLVTSVISNITEDFIPHNDDEQLLNELAKFYNSCMNEQALDDLGSKPLEELVNHIKSLWENFDLASSPLRERLTSTIAFLHSVGVPVMFDIKIEGDVGTDPTFLVPFITPTHTSLLAEHYYHDQHIMGAYKALIETIVLMMDDVEDPPHQPPMWPPWPWPPWDRPNKEGNKARARRMASSVLDFERKISGARFHLSPGDPIDSYNSYSLSQFKELFPHFDFSLYLSTFSVRSYPSKIIIPYPSYFSNISDIISNTNSDTLKVHFIVWTVFHLSENLSAQAEGWKLSLKLLALLNGVQKGISWNRGEWCAEKTEDALGHAVGKVFVESVFTEDVRSNSEHFVQDIVEAFRSSFMSLAWMDAESSAAAVSKANSINLKLGYPLSPNAKDARSVLTYYKDISVGNRTFFLNVLNSRISKVKKKWQQLGTRRNKDAWRMVPSQVGVYFDSSSNEITLPAGILQPPFFSVDWPPYLVFGALGVVAANELTHAFDSKGSMYNQNGKLEPWWTNATLKKFNEVRDCIAAQYSRYSINDSRGGRVYLGNISMEQQIADLGLMQAYRAWNTSFHTPWRGDDFLLPGLNFTSEQLFFISFGISLAQNSASDSEIKELVSHAHAPNRIRVHGTLSNTPEFGMAFNCVPGSKLYPLPKDRCHLW